MVNNTRSTVAKGAAMRALLSSLLDFVWAILVTRKMYWKYYMQPPLPPFKHRLSPLHPSLHTQIHIRPRPHSTGTLLHEMARMIENNGMTIDCETRNKNNSERERGGGEYTQKRWIRQLLTSRWEADCGETIRKKGAHQLRVRLDCCNRI